MGSKIYVGGLPYSTTEQQLSDLFAVHGAVTSARIITDKFTGQSRGFGFVEMPGKAHSLAAIAVANEIGIALADREQRFVCVNQQFALLTGLPPAEHEGRAVAEVFGASDALAAEGFNARTFTPGAVGPSRLGSSPTASTTSMGTTTEVPW